ncbi:outer membrane protein [Bacteroides sp. 224]|uniref:outer membrane protein n=1 Tax=Bacteroides sp. 224 TaxID=2302936 RepID=UPI0013D85DEB|nr:outer membrane beta-barrel protein [Bacteroides sp. 224]NDV66398.1 autotransporter outer membrane beta-barrel domain-containing protein [Bacteroides sp. 224]
MKKLFIIAIIFMIGSNAMAQKGEMAGGILLNYGTEIESLGIGAKFQYGITDAIRIEPSFDYYFGKNDFNMFDFNANVHYLFNVAPKINIYPLAGLGYTSWKTVDFDFDFGYDDDDFDLWTRANYDDDDDYDEYDSGSSRSGKIAINLGAGAEYQLTNKLKINAELKYQIISNFNQLVFGVGLAYKF